MSKLTALTRIPRSASSRAAVLKRKKHKHHYPTNISMTWFSCWSPITIQDFHHPCHGFFIIVVATICSLWACLRQPCSCCRRLLQGTLEGRSRWKCGGKLTNWQFLERNNIMPEQSARQKISRTFCFKEKSSNTYWSEELNNSKPWGFLRKWKGGKYGANKEPHWSSSHHWHLHSLWYLWKSIQIKKFTAFS